VYGVFLFQISTLFFQNPIVTRTNYLYLKIEGRKQLRSDIYTELWYIFLVVFLFFFMVSSNCQNIRNVYSYKFFIVLIMETS